MATLINIGNNIKVNPKFISYFEGLEIVLANKHRFTVTADVIELVKAYVENRNTGALHYKGNVSSVSNLPSTGNVDGDMYLVTGEDKYYAWNGTSWAEQVTIVNISSLESSLSSEVSRAQAKEAELQEAVETQGEEIEGLVNELKVKTTVTPAVKAGMIVNSSSLIASAADSYKIAYYSASEECDVQLTFGRQSTYVHDGRVFLADDESSLIVGETVNVIEQVDVGVMKTINRHLTSGQVFGVSMHNADALPVIAVIRGGAIDRLNESIAVIETEMSDLPSLRTSANTLIYADTHKMEPTGYAGIVVNASNVLTTNGIDSSFTIQTIDASNTDRYCKVRIQRKSASAYAGKVFLTDSLSSGTTVELLHQAVKDEIEEHRILIPAGKILGISVIRNTSDFLEVKLFDYASPTDYSGGDARVFNHILCIGDSLTQGVFNATTNKVQYSYPTYLAKLTGSAVTNLGIAGITSQQWYETYQNSEVLEGHDCCIIQLGVNDSTDTIESVTKPALRNIIALLKLRNPHCHIFLSGIINGQSYRASMSSENYYAKDQAIKALYESDYSNDDKVHLIDHVKYGHLRTRIYSLQDEGGYSGYSDDYNEGHLTAYGYWRLALDYYNYISYIMHTDDNKVFKDIQRNTVIQ